MKKIDLKDKQILLLTVAAVSFIGVLALMSKKIFRPHRSGQRAAQPKKHSYLKIPKDTLRDYIKDGGSKIKFEFTDDNGRIKLNFIGFTADNKEFIRRKMKRVKLKDKSLVNIDFGVFTNNDKDQLLHDLIAKGSHEETKDWFLKPVKCEVAEGYVSYELCDVDPCGHPAPGFLSYRINPCPPCNTPPTS